MSEELNVMRKTEITPADIMAIEAYQKDRRQLRRDLIEKKKHRRLDVGPHVTFYFENFDTMLAQVQEMLYIERGGDEQLKDELEAYNPLIPQGKELVATMMIEIEDEKRRARALAQLGWIEDKVTFKFAGHEITAVPEDDVERTTEEGKTSSVHFLTFTFTDAQITAFKAEGEQVILSIGHENYGHMAVLPEAVKVALAEDFDS